MNTKTMEKNIKILEDILASNKQLLLFNSNYSALIKKVIQLSNLNDILILELEGYKKREEAEKLSDAQSQ